MCGDPHSDAVKQIVWVLGATMHSDTVNPEAHPLVSGEILMYYPASYDWPAGEIDINGGQY